MREKNEEEERVEKESRKMGEVELDYGTLEEKGWVPILS